MRLSARISAVLTALLAAACFAGGIRGFLSLAAITDPLVRSDARGFAGFWTFLGCVFLGLAVLSWRARPVEEP